MLDVTTVTTDELLEAIRAARVVWELKYGSVIRTIWNGRCPVAVACGLDSNGFMGSIDANQVALAADGRQGELRARLLEACGLSD